MLQGRECHELPPDNSRMVGNGSQKISRFCSNLWTYVAMDIIPRCLTLGHIRPDDRGYYIDRRVLL